MGLYQNDEFLEVKLLGEKSTCIYNFARHCKISLHGDHTNPFRNVGKRLLLHTFFNMIFKIRVFHFC